MSEQSIPRHERLGVFILGAIQFVNILDFMIVMPLGPDFARALGSLLNDQPAIIRMGAAARERSEQFTWAATAEAFAEVLASATGQSTPHVSVAPAPSGHVEHHRPDDAWDQLSP